MSIEFVVHDDGDSVGVVVIEGVEAGQILTGWIMDQNKTIEFAVKDAIPIGHKLAIRCLDVNDTVIKYGQDIGRVIQPIQQGEHLHVHNVKTKRW
ncbi:MULTISPECIES: SAF domain-containing protein [unclassified Raoultella]|uniref:SAF domain-containing protein n=1 Tax=unclassified Raoultella TaxID=2627600 RepID=UPI001359643C|nr:MULTISPECIES: SAF domain-containing protein [unclassified Raoultella]